MKTEIKYLLDITNAINACLQDEDIFDINNMYPTIKTLFRFRGIKFPSILCKNEAFKISTFCNYLRHRKITRVELSVSDNAKYSSNGFYDYFSLFNLSLCNDKSIRYMTIKSGYRNNDNNVYLTFEETNRTCRICETDCINKYINKLCDMLPCLEALTEDLGLDGYKTLFNKAYISMTQNNLDLKQLQGILLDLCVFGNMNSFNDEPYVKAEETGRLSEYLLLSEELWNLLLKCIASVTKRS